MQARPVFEPALQGSENSVLAVFHNCLSDLTDGAENLRLDLVPGCTSVHDDAEIACLIESISGKLFDFPLFFTCVADPHCHVSELLHRPRIRHLMELIEMSLQNCEHVQHEFDSCSFLWEISASEHVAQFYQQQQKQQNAQPESAEHKLDLFPDKSKLEELHLYLGTLQSLQHHTQARDPCKVVGWLRIDFGRFKQSVKQLITEITTQLLT